MGQFKPMPKMETTEPSVVLKLKVGGFVNKKKDAKEDNGFKPMKKNDGGMMGSNMPPMIKPPVANVAPVARPSKPSMMDRAKAMKVAQMLKAKAAPMAPEAPMAAMKKGGEALFKGKETYKEELAEGKAIKSGKVSPEQYAKKEGKEPAMKKTGGVAKAQGGFGKGGSIKKATGVRCAQAGGLQSNDKVIAENTKGFNDTYKTQEAENKADRDLIPNAIGKMYDSTKQLLGQGVDAAKKGINTVKEYISPTTKAVTKETVTVVPKQRKGGMCKK